MKDLLFISALAAMVLSGCNRNQPEQDLHTQTNEGPEPIVYTLYSAKTELFVEFGPLIAGQTSKFATHITVLGETFRPMSEGSVTLSMTSGTSNIRNTAKAPQVPGIFRLSIKPEATGKVTLAFDIRTKEFSDRFVIKNITVYADEKSAMSAHHHHDEGETVTYLKEQAWKTEFANAEASMIPVSQVIRATGEILPASGDETVVTAPADGIIMISDTQTAPGSAVKKGARLFTITSGGLAGRNVDVNFQESKTRYEKAKANYERLSELVKEKIVSENEFQAAKAEYQNAEAEYMAIARNYEKGGQSVPVPSNGYIKNLAVTQGQYVTAGTPLAVISGTKRLQLRAEVSQKHFQQLSFIQGANFRTSASGETYSTEALNGKLISYGKSAMVETPFIPVTFEIDNDGTIIAGSHAEVLLKTTPGAPVLAIPISSLMEEQGSFFIYVQTAGESFQKREVKTGRNDGLNVEIASGISEGERVVTKGAFQIKLATASGVFPEHGHEH